MLEFDQYQIVVLENKFAPQLVPTKLPTYITGPDHSAEVNKSTLHYGFDSDELGYLRAQKQFPQTIVD